MQVNFGEVANNGCRLVLVGEESTGKDTQIEIHHPDGTIGIVTKADDEGTFNWPFSLLAEMLKDQLF